MAIGDTWETINTYSFVAGETIITADYENDVVNNLQYLYTHPTSAVNIYTGSANTNVTLTASTNDILAGVTLTFTPVQGKVALLVFTDFSTGWTQATGTNVTVGYKVNTGAITYFTQDNASYTHVNTGTVSATAGSSNTITMYLKNGDTASQTFYNMRVVAIEMAN